MISELSGRNLICIDCEKNARDAKKYKTDMDG